MPVSGVKAAAGFVRRHRRFFIAGAIFALCLLIFYVFWVLQVAEARGKSRSFFLNDAQQAATAPLGAEGGPEQTFVIDEEFHALGVVPLYDGAAAGTLHARLYDASGAEVAAADGNAAETVSGQYAVFVFGQTLPAGTYTLALTADTGEVAVALAKSEAAPAGWQLAGAAGEDEGALCLLAATDRIGGFLTRFYWAFALLGAFLAAGVYLLAAFGVRVHRLYAVAAAGLCLLFCLILPPYAAPDEEYHINQVYTISSWFLGQSDYKPEWGTTVRRAADHDPLIQDRNTTVFTYRQVAENFFTLAGDSTPQTYSDYGVDEYRIPYWPTAAVMTLCRLLRLGFVPTLYVCRFFNVAMFVALAALAVRITPVGKGIFAAVGLLPMTLHMAASLSRDCFTNGAYLLFTALCLYYAVEKPKFTGRDLLLAAGFILLISRAKIVYAPLLLLVLFIPWQKFELFKKALARKWVWLVKAALVALIFSHMFSNIADMVRMVWLEFLAQLDGTSTYVIAAQLPRVQMAPPPPEAGEVNFTIWDFFVRGGQIFWLLVRSLFTQFTFYVSSLVGGNLGYYSLPLSGGFVFACLALLALALWPEPGAPLLNKKQRWAGAAMVAAITGLVLLGCILWTPTGYDIIYGIQGRYFLPVLPLAMCCASRNWLGLQKTRSTVPAVIFGFTGVGVFALLNAFLLILER